MTDIENFCSNVTKLREKYALTKKTMAEKLGISLWMLNKIESGELPERITVEVLFNIGKEFKIPPKVIFENWK